MSSSGKRDTVLLDDAKLIDCRNGSPAAGSVLKELEDAIKVNAARYRPIYSMWGGTDMINSNAFMRQLWIHASPASPGLGAMFLTLPSTGAVVADQSIVMSVDATTDYSHSPPAPFDASNPMRYPTNARGSVPLSFPMAADMNRHEVRLGSNTANGPQLRAAAVYERINPAPTDQPFSAPQTIGDFWLSPGSWILGTDAGDSKIRSTRGLRDYYRRVMKSRRLVFGWSGINGAAAPYATGGAKSFFSTHRYIFDANYGEGGTAPTISSPGITVPLYRSAVGKNTTVRLYISLYARMIGGGTGTLRYYHRADDGVSMTGLLTPTNSPTVSGSTFIWYGSVGIPLSEANDCYMLGNATLPYDRIVPCIAGSGGTMEVGAFTIHAYHSEQ